MFLLTAIGLTPGGSSTVHIYTQTIHRTTQLTTWLEGFLRFEPRVVKLRNWEECGPCPVCASYTLAFVLQLMKNHGETCQARKNSARARKNLGQVFVPSPLFLLFRPLSSNFAGSVYCVFKCSFSKWPSAAKPACQ